MQIIQTCILLNLIRELFVHEKRSEIDLSCKVPQSQYKFRNYLLDHDINRSIEKFENILKMKSIILRDDFWLPCNHDTFSFVTLYIVMFLLCASMALVGCDVYRKRHYRVSVTQCLLLNVCSINLENVYPPVRYIHKLVIVTPLLREPD